MEVEQVLHMNAGEGKTSYACNSTIQRTVINQVKPILEESLVKVYNKMDSGCLTIADLGCSSGPNTLLVVSEIIEIIRTTCDKLNKKPPSLLAFLNDLPGNDFNTVFKSWSRICNADSKKLVEDDRTVNGGYDFGVGRCNNVKGIDKKYSGPNCFIAGVPGSFYGRLFPNKSLHFVHSSYALMWTSQAPKVLNKGNICIAKTSPLEVYETYLDTFEGGFTLFLKSRGEEVVSGGRMVLTTMGSIKSDDPLCIWEFVGLKLNDMVFEGLIEEEKLDTFNIPYYAPTLEELKDVVEKEGSFTLERLEVFKMDWDTYIKKGNPKLDKKARASIFANDMRAVGEPLLSSQFGEAVMDDLFRRFEDDVLDYMTDNGCQFMSVVISLTKKDHIEG